MSNDPSNYSGIVEDQTTTIASGATKSAAVNVYGTTICAIEIPSTFTGTSISFEGSIDGTNFAPIYDMDGVLVSISGVSASKTFVLNPTIFYAYRSIKIVSGSTEGAERTIKYALTLI